MRQCTLTSPADIRTIRRNQKARQTIAVCRREEEVNGGFGPRSFLQVRSTGAPDRRVMCVMRNAYSLKEVIPVGAIVLARQHAATLETEGRTRRDMDRFAQVSQPAPCSHARPYRRV
jgi:hypothetical protein